MLLGLAPALFSGKLKGKGSPCHSIGGEVLPIQVKVLIQAVKFFGAGILQMTCVVEYLFYFGVQRVAFDFRI